MVRALAAVALATAAGACTVTSDPAGLTQADTQPPTVAVVPQTAPNDSSIAFTLNASDNMGLLVVGASLSGPGITGSVDTTFTSAVTSVSLPYVITVPGGTPPGTLIMVIGSAVDGAHNLSKPDTAFVATAAASPALASPAVP